MTKHPLLFVALLSLLSVVAALIILHFSPGEQGGQLEGVAITQVSVLEEDGSVLDAIRTLPENYRNAIYLHYYEGYTAAEIGRMMAVPTNTVLSWLRRARAQLHTMLKEEIEDEVV